jgi:hypothetical protein
MVAVDGGVQAYLAHDADGGGTARGNRNGAAAEPDSA